MAKVVITPLLKTQVERRFKQDSSKIFRQMHSLSDNPNKGKVVGNVKEIVLKEIKYLNYRFYFITDGRVLRFGSKIELEMLLVKFLGMSSKKDQRKIIKKILENLKV